MLQKTSFARFFRRKIRHKNPKIQIYPVFQWQKGYSKPKIWFFDFLKNTDPLGNPCLSCLWTDFEKMLLDFWPGFKSKVYQIYDKSVRRELRKGVSDANFEGNKRQPTLQIRTLFISHPRTARYSCTDTEHMHGQFSWSYGRCLWKPKGSFLGMDYPIS